MRASLEEFARTRRFGAIELGITRSAVEQELGLPDEWGGQRNCQSADIWKYGDIEFHFRRNALRMIFMDDFTVPIGGEKVQLEAWIVNGELAIAEAQSALMAAAIPFTHEEFPYKDNGIRLITSANTIFSFSSENSSCVTLDAVFCKIDPKAV